MGHVIKNGLDALGSGRSYYLDKDFQAEVQTMMDLGKSPSTLPREKKHINAVKLWAQGCVSAYEQHQHLYFINLFLCFGRRFKKYEWTQLKRNQASYFKRRSDALTN